MMKAFEIALGFGVTVTLAFVIGVIAGAWMQEKNTRKQAKCFEDEDTPPWRQ